MADDPARPLFGVADLLVQLRVNHALRGELLDGFVTIETFTDQVILEAFDVRSDRDEAFRALFLERATLGTKLRYLRTALRVLDMEKENEPLLLELEAANELRNHLAHRTANPTMNPDLSLSDALLFAYQKDGKNKARRYTPDDARSLVARCLRGLHELGKRTGKVWEERTGERIAYGAEIPWLLGLTLPLDDT
jgi:hypothetical protein